MAGICECGNELSGYIKCGNFLTSCEPVSFSRRTLLHGVSIIIIITTTTTTTTTDAAPAAPEIPL